MEVHETVASRATSIYASYHLKPVISLSAWRVSVNSANCLKSAQYDVLVMDARRWQRQSVSSLNMKGKSILFSYEFIQVMYKIKKSILIFRQWKWRCGCCGYRQVSKSSFLLFVKRETEKKKTRFKLYIYIKYLGTVQSLSGRVQGCKKVVLLFQFLRYYSIKKPRLNLTKINLGGKQDHHSVGRKPNQPRKRFKGPIP